MKKTLYFLSMIAFLASCQSAPSGENAQTAEQQEASKATGTAYKVDNTMSSLTFVGSKPVGTHTGTFKLTEGNITVDQGNISSGKFTFDIGSMNIIDQDTSYKAKLTGHLLSPDFFDAAKFKTATFEITACEPLTNDTNGTHRISGNLTMKDSTKNVTFTSKVSVTESQLKATADFNIDRTQWGLFYGNDKSLGDKFIYPEVKIKFDITANK